MTVDEPEIFVSYAHVDTGFVAALAGALKAAGVPVWFDHDLVSGDRWDLELRARVDRAAAIVVVMSPEAAASSWGRLEVGRARYQGRPLHPILPSGTPVAGWSGNHAVRERLPCRLVAVEGARQPAAKRSSQPRIPSRSGASGGRCHPSGQPALRGSGQALLELESGLHWGGSVGIEALRGTGGVGKTQLAAQYARRRRGDYDLIGWIDAEHPKRVPGQLATLAAVLDLPGATGVDTDADKVAREVLAELGRTERFWLLVFDNAEHADRLRQWLPRESAGHVIVTSRHRGWDGLAATIDVDVLDRPDSVALLRNSLPSLDGQVADGAVKAAEEAVSLYRQLIAVDRSAHLPNFAASVNNLALRLGEVGRWA